MTRGARPDEAEETRGGMSQRKRVGGTSASGKQETGPTRQQRRARDRRRRQVTRRLRILRTAGIAAFMLATITAFIIVLAAHGNHTPSQPAATSADWVSLKSTAPADVQSAVRATRTYQTALSAPQTGLGHELQVGTLGTPVLVHVYHPTNGATDTWVVPVLDPSAPGAHVVALLDFAYDATHARMRATTFAGPFAPGDPEYGQPFPRTTASQAAARFSAAHVSAAFPSGQPELVYFSADLDKIAGPHPPMQWSGGGQFPDLAVWRISAGGTDYLVGLDGKVYPASQAPLAA